MLEGVARNVSEAGRLIFLSETDYSKHCRNGYGFLALAYTMYYCVHPALSLPLYAAAGYNFVQASRIGIPVLIRYHKKRMQEIQENLRARIKEDSKS